MNELTYDELIRRGVSPEAAMKILEQQEERYMLKVAKTTNEAEVRPSWQEKATEWLQRYSYHRALREMAKHYPEVPPAEFNDLANRLGKR